MLSQRQSDMAVVLDDIVPIRHLPKCHLRLVLLGNCCRLAFGGCRKQGQGLVAQRLDHPERIASFEFERWQEGIRFCQLDKRFGWNTGPAPHVIDCEERIVHARYNDPRRLSNRQSVHLPKPNR